MYFLYDIVYNNRMVPVMVVCSRGRVLLVMRLPRIGGSASGTVMMVHRVGMIHLTSGVMRVMIIAVPKRCRKVSGRHGRSI